MRTRKNNRTLQLKQMPVPLICSNCEKRIIEYEAVTGDLQKDYEIAFRRYKWKTIRVRHGADPHGFNDIDLCPECQPQSKTNQK